MISNTTTSPLIETDQLAQLLQDNTKNLTIIDCNFPIDLKTWVIAPYTDWDNTFKTERIPTARPFAVIFYDKSSGIPYMMPTLEQFIQTMKDLDIGINDQIVIYGDDSVTAAMRLWWILRTFGCANVQVLNGKYSKWRKEGKSVENGDESWKTNKRDRTDDDFKFVYNKAMMTSMDDIKEMVKDKKIGDSVMMVDARSEEMFKGETNQTFGHIPGAMNIVVSEFLNLDDDETFKTPEEIAKIVESRKVDVTKPIVTSCRGGITANVLGLGLTILGAQNVSLYDGSWNEWSKYPENPIERGPAN